MVILVLILFRVVIVIFGQSPNIEKANAIYERMRTCLSSTTRLGPMSRRKVATNSSRVLAVGLHGDGDYHGSATKSPSSWRATSRVMVVDLAGLRQTVFAEASRMVQCAGEFVGSLCQARRSQSN